MPLPPADSDATAETLASGLLVAADAGVPGAVPAGADREALAEQVQAVRAAGRATLAALRAAEAGIDRAAAGPTAEVEHDLSRMRAVFGEAFPAAPIFRAGKSRCAGGVARRREGAAGGRFAGARHLARP